MEQETIVCCDNCLFVFNLDTNLPMLLPCGHTVCKKCLNSIWNRFAYIKCPFDGKKHFQDLKTYVTNSIIEDIVIKYSEEVKNKSIF